jgi:predicted  nucleic acid-binding Zn-ribbon protein
MGYEQLPPEVPTWSTGITTEDQNEIKRLEAQVAALREDLADMFNVGPVCLECQRKDDRIKALEDALNKIADPISYLQSKAEKEGKQLDGQMVIAFSNSANCLKDIARAALEVKP